MGEKKEKKKINFIDPWALMIRNPEFSALPVAKLFFDFLF
jgi:hypothetical protein